MKPTPKPIEDIEVIYNDPLNPEPHYGIKDVRDIEVEYETVK
jgi:hypothetical protein